MEKELKTKYITEEDYKLYFGVDLANELETHNNPSNETNAFLKRIEVRMSAFLDANFFQNIDLKYPEFSDYQKEHYKYALLEQAHYILLNGDIATDSGYDMERGEVASNTTLTSKALSPIAVEHLKICGLLSNKIRFGVRGGIYGFWR